jgi:hypothetical protein
MRYLAAVAGSFTALLFVAGCETAPTPASSRPTAAAKPAASQAAPVAVAPVAAPKPTAATQPSFSAPVIEQPIAAPKLSPEAAALVERLTGGGGALPHEMAEATSFASAIESLQPGAPAPRIEPNDGSPQPPARGLTADGNTTALVERDWTGLVLVPISTSLSKAYTSDVRLTKVEAHPLNDGRVRIWTRVHNTGSEALSADIACEFRMKSGGLNSPYFYQLDVPGYGYRDVFFVSPDGQLNSYTVLVRSADAVKR